MAANDKRIWKFIDKKAWDPAWEQVLCFFAGKLAEAEPLGNSPKKPEKLRHLLKLLSEKKNDDLFRHRLGVAALCLGEFPQGARETLKPDVDAVASATFASWLERVRSGAEKAVIHLRRGFAAIARERSGRGSGLARASARAAARRRLECARVGGCRPWQDG